MNLLENLTAPGGGPPPHIHTRNDEFFYVLDVDSGPGSAVDDDDIPRTMLGAPRYGLAAV
jgi:hypothetical protein